MKPSLILCVAMALTTCGCHKSSSKNPPAGTGTGTESAPKPVASLTSDQLLAEYQKNPIAADQKYKGQLVEVSGKIGKIGKSVLGAPYVNLGAVSEEDFFGVSCYLAASAVDDVAKMQPGTAVKIRGICKGQFGGQALELKECEFVK
jgi:putative nucleic acid binding protein